VFGSGDTLSGAFVLVQQGVLAGLEVYGLAGDAPSVLPTPAMLRPFGAPPAAAASSGSARRPVGPGPPGGAYCAYVERRAGTRLPFPCRPPPPARHA
jgi:hypothetical protein